MFPKKDSGNGAWEVEFSSGNYYRSSLEQVFGTCSQAPKKGNQSVEFGIY